MYCLRMTLVASLKFPRARKIATRWFDCSILGQVGHEVWFSVVAFFFAGGSHQTEQESGLPSDPPLNVTDF